MNVFDGSFVKKMYTPYGGTHTNLAAKCKVLPKQSEYIENVNAVTLWGLYFFKENDILLRNGVKTRIQNAKWQNERKSNERSSEPDGLP